MLCFAEELEGGRRKMFEVLSRIAVVFVALAAFWGCSPSVLKMYPGPELPADEVATLEFHEPIRVNSLDGKEVSLNWGVIAVLPGTHTISITYYNAFSAPNPNVSSYKYSMSNMTLTFDAKPGHTYGIMYSREGNSWSAWIENLGR
jgi:hypothetical protein